MGAAPRSSPSPTWTFSLSGPRRIGKLAISSSPPISSFVRLEHAIKRPCGDPGESGGTLDVYLDQGSRARASEQAKQAAAVMTEALAQVTLKREAEAIPKVAALFGAPFPRR